MHPTNLYRNLFFWYLVVLALAVPSERVPIVPPSGDDKSVFLAAVPDCFDFGLSTMVISVKVSHEHLSKDQVLSRFDAIKHDAFRDE